MNFFHNSYRTISSLNGYFTRSGYRFKRLHYNNRHIQGRMMCTKKNKDFDESEAKILLSEVPKLIEDANILKYNEGDPVVEFQHPEELKKTVDFSLGPGNTLDKLREYCCAAVRYSVRTAHPHFHNQLYSGPDIYGLAASWILDSLNTNIHTYEISPFFTLCEEAVLKHILEIINFPPDPNNPTCAGEPVGDGIFGPGGSIGNFYGMILARYYKAPQVKAKGMGAVGEMVAFTSEDSHYSVEKFAHILGIGLENMVRVKTDNCGRMCTLDLTKKICAAKAENKCPFLVNATAGTTVLGVIDPLEEIAEICKEHCIWMHADACLAGSLMFSKKYGCRLNGLNQADSLVWNPHKLIGAPLQCSMFLTRHKDILFKSNSAAATYLFQKDKFYDVKYDTGDKSIQCGRKPDAFKLWMMWKARGDAGFEKSMDNAMSCAEHFKSVLKKMEGFRLVQELTHITSVCFWYIPPCMRNQTEDEEWHKRLNLVAPEIKKILMLSGVLMIGYSPLPSRKLKNFFRMTVTCQPAETFENMEFVICEIKRVGETLK